MKLTSLLLLLVTTVATAQQKRTYEYTRLNDSTRQFTSEAIIVHFFDYKRSVKNLKERRVSVNGEGYLFAINESKAGPVQKIYDPSGTSVATVFLGTVNLYDIVSGSAHLKWKSIDADNWVYSLNEVEVVRCSYRKVNDKQHIDLTYDDALPFVVQLACLEKSITNIKANDYTGKEGGTQFGIKAGLNLSILSASINSESNFRSGMNFGVYIKTPIGKNVFFRPEIYYSSQGQQDKYTYNTGVDAGETTTKLEYLNIPLIFELGKNVTFQTGMQLGILLSAHEKGRITTQTVDDDLKKLMKPVDLSMVIGIGGNLSRHINVGARYNYGLFSIFKDEYQPYPGLDFPEVQNRVLHFFIACSL